VKKIQDRSDVTDAIPPPLPLQLADFRNRHAGATLLICGCGESLNRLEHPERFITIGVNDVSRRFDPDYLVVVNPREQFTGDRFGYVERSNARYLFTQLDLGTVRPPVVRFRLGRYAGVDFDDPQVLHYTQNSPYVALCLAVHLGAKRIGLIGVDFTEHHFFGQTGKHVLADRLSTINREYAALGEACRARGIEIVNLSPASLLNAFPRFNLAAFTGLISPRTEPVSRMESPLNIVSYATTPVAGVPAILARCIAERTAHRARCVWATDSYGNGVRFQGDIQWTENPTTAREALEAANLIIVHNGKVDPAHHALIESKPAIVLAHNYAWNVDTQLVERGRPGAVVGQYQALLPEFRDWTAVPNPLPFWEEAFQPGAKNDTVTVAYTPSGQHECYPPDHRLYWHGKGYATTLRVLERLAARYPLQLNLIRDRQLSHAESLAMKREAHIVIDECVTGSYHRNSLEGLAAGAVVVNGLGLLPGLPELLRELAGEEPPFARTGLDQLEAVLAGLIEEGPARLAERGRTNRLWLERHWDFTEQWERHWIPLVERALNGHERVRPLIPAAVPTVPTRMTTSVVIPHGGSERLPHLTACLAKLTRCRGVGEIIVVELGSEPSAGELARRHGARYRWLSHVGPFQRARALNAGSALAEGELILWLDNDLLSPKAFVEQAAAELRERELDYLIPYTDIAYLGETDSRAVQADQREPALCRPDKVLRGGCDISGGAGLVRRDFLARFGGLDEAFWGWGGEDNAWLHKARMLGRIGTTRYPNQRLFHLYHPASGAHAGRPLTHPDYAANLARLREYATARDGATLLNRFPPPPPVWLYWEGVCPDWIRACQRTIFAHALSARLLGPEDFQRLWDRDRDIDLSRLPPAQRADFVRAFLLAHHGGLWLDSDCLAMQSPQPIMDLLADHDFVAHRDRQGYYPNGFMAARPGSRIAAELYRRVCERLRAGRPIGWIALGGEILTAILRTSPEPWHELPCERIQPICWSDPGAFFRIDTDEGHARIFDPQAFCYMLSNTEVGKYRTVHPGADLLADGTFFRYLLERALSGPPASAQTQTQTQPRPRPKSEHGARWPRYSKLSTGQDCGCGTNRYPALAPAWLKPPRSGGGCRAYWRNSRFAPCWMRAAAIFTGSVTPI
jgi:GT2 family glycosyltransferase